MGVGVRGRGVFLWWGGRERERVGGMMMMMMMGGSFGFGFLLLLLGVCVCVVWCLDWWRVMRFVGGKKKGGSFFFAFLFLGKEGGGVRGRKGGPGILFILTPDLGIWMVWIGLILVVANEVSFTLDSEKDGFWTTDENGNGIRDSFGVDAIGSVCGTNRLANHGESGIFVTSMFSPEMLILLRGM